MKKIIVPIIVIGLLLSVTSATTIGMETEEKATSDDELILYLPTNKIIVEEEELEDVADGIIPITKSSEPEYVPGELIIKFKDEIEENIIVSQDGTLITSIPSVDALNIRYKVSSANKIFKNNQIASLSKAYTFTLPSDSDIPSIAEEYNNDSCIEFAEPNYIPHLHLNEEPVEPELNDEYPSDPSFIPDDPYFEDQWALHNTGQNGGTPDADIDAPEAWETTMGDEDVVIAILDSGVDYNHPDLADNMWINEDEIPGNGIDDDNNDYIDDVRGWDFGLDSNDPLDYLGHGTLCAGVAAAVTNNSEGIAGVAGDCKIMPLIIGSMSATAEAIVYAADNGADVISMSFGFFILIPEPKGKLLLNLAISYADLKGVVLVSSAGNEDTRWSEPPTSHHKVIAVSATDRNDTKTWWSNHGVWVDVCAPGSNIYSTMPTYHVPFNDDYDLPYNYTSRFAGTSASSPFVAGVVGLMLSKNPDLTPREVRTILRSSTDPVTTDNYIGTGRINANKALDKVNKVVAELDHSLDGMQSFCGIKELKGTKKINGKAYGNGFQQYVLECSRGMYPKEDSWITIESSCSPNYGVSPLVYWDTTLVGDGLYTLRLRVTANNLTYYDQTLITIGNEKNTFYVDDDNVEGPWEGSQQYPFKSIQRTIDGCGKNNGDEIIVKSGIYYEYLLIYDKSLKLLGENKENTIIQRNAFLHNGIYMSSSSVEISGFTFIKNNLGGDGIRAVFSSNCLVTDNHFYSTNHLMGGIFFDIGCRNNLITGNTLTNTSGIGVGGSFTKNNVVSDNTLTDIAGSGIYILWGGCSKNKIYSNIIADFISYSDYSGIYLGWGTSNNEVYDNVISTIPTRCGIELEGGDNNDIHDNIVSNNKHGIRFTTVIRGDTWWERNLFNHVYNNTLSDNDYGIYMTPSKDRFKNEYNKIYGNDISDNRLYGIYVEAENKNNKVFYNNFIGNGQNAYDEGSNTWHNYKLMGESKGNYWDDYTGEDADGDGIGDTPYFIPGGDNKDKYPLMEPCEENLQYSEQSSSSDQQTGQSSPSDAQGSIPSNS
jgi:parallel beta-helix repeat protein